MPSSTHLITAWFGCFLCNGQQVTFKPFPPDAGSIARRLRTMMGGGVLEEERDLLSGSAVVVVCESRLKHMGEYAPSDPFFASFRSRLSPPQYGYGSQLLREAMTDLSREALAARMEAGREEEELSWVIRTLGDLMGMSKHLAERLGDRPPEAMVEPIARYRSLTQDTINRLEALARELIIQIAPNVAKLVGPLLGARVLVAAGGLGRLAHMPSGTVQTLGAEKALFRHLKDGVPPPKHGLLYQHSLVSRAPKGRKGAMARALAAKVCIAARADAYTHRPIAAELMRQLERLDAKKERLDTEGV